MRSVFVAALASLLLCSSTAQAEQQPLIRGGGLAPSIASPNNPTSSPFVCQVEMQISNYEEGHEEDPVFYCNIAGTVYDVEFPSDFLDHEDYIRKVPGTTCVSIPDAQLDSHSVTVKYSDASLLAFTECDAQGEQMQQYSKQRRSLQFDTTGTQTLLVVRMSAYMSPNEKIEPALSVSDIEGHWYKTGKDIPSGKTVSVIEQFDSCSNGKLKIVKAKGSKIINGVADVTAPFGTVINDEQTGAQLTRDLRAAAEAHLGYDPNLEFDFVAYVFPDDVVKFVRSDGESRPFVGADAAFVRQESMPLSLPAFVSHKIPSY